MRTIENVEHFEDKKFFFTLVLSPTCKPSWIIDFDLVDDLEEWSQCNRENIEGDTIRTTESFEDWYELFDETHAKEWLDCGYNLEGLVTLDSVDDVDFPVYARTRTGYLMFSSEDSCIISSRNRITNASFPQVMFNSCMMGDLNYGITTEERYKQSLNTVSNPKSKVA